MPRISSFCGVPIYLDGLDTRQHRLPHIHAMYAGDEAVSGIETGQLLAAKLPRRQARIVQAWLEIHPDELIADGSLAVKGQPGFAIDPLK